MRSRKTMDCRGEGGEGGGRGRGERASAASERARSRPRSCVLIGSPGVSNTGDQSGCQHRTDFGNVMKALARFVGAVPDHDHPIELHDLLLEAEQLIAERGKAGAGNLRHPFVTRVGNNVEQFGDSFAPDRRDDAKFGKVSPDRINRHVCCE